jgi:putative serine protease PepD
MRRLLPYLLSAVLGGLVVVAAVGLGRSDTSTTVRAPRAAGLSAGELYRRAAPGVVYVRTPGASGAGFEIDRAGHVLTNAHVVNGAQRVTVRFGTGAQSLSRPGRVVGTDPSTDVAVLQVDTRGIALHPLSFADSSAVAVGDATFAIGNPFGLDHSLTTGVVSAVARKIDAPNGVAIGQAIQTDAALNPGNSGGPLLDDRGRVIGISSQIVSGSMGGQGSNSGIGFAVPSNTAKRVASALVQGTPVPRV